MPRRNQSYDDVLAEAAEALKWHDKGEIRDPQRHRKLFADGRL